MGNETIYDEMDLHSYDTSNHVVCVCFLDWRSQQQVSSAETHKDAETCLPDDLFHQLFLAPLLVLWKYCSTYLPLRNSYWLRYCKGHTESLLVGSGLSTELVPLGKRKAMLIFAMRQEDSYLCCKCQLTEYRKLRYSREISNVKLWIKTMLSDLKAF